MNIAYMAVTSTLREPENQEYTIKDFCKEQGVTIDKYVIDIKEGKRPYQMLNIGAVIEKMEAGDRIICTEINRLSMDFKETMSILEKILERGGEIWTIYDDFQLGGALERGAEYVKAFAKAAEIWGKMCSRRAIKSIERRKLEGTYKNTRGMDKRVKNILIEKRDEILRMKEAGENLKCISLHIGVARSTLVRHIDKL